jgi:hypothetical protein
LIDRIRLISAHGWHRPDARLVDMGAAGGARTARWGRPMCEAIGVNRLACRSHCGRLRRLSTWGSEAGGRPVSSATASDLVSQRPCRMDSNMVV